MSEPGAPTRSAARLFPLLLLALLGACADSGTLGAAGRAGGEVSDVYPEAPFSHPTCDFGVLRGTKNMRCADEFKRREWFLWT